MVLVIQVKNLLTLVKAPYVPHLPSLKLMMPVKVYAADNPALQFSGPPESPWVKREQYTIL